jgi:hypothetical protein
MRLYFYLFLALCLPVSVFAKDIKVTYQAGDNLRSLAQTHLANPDLWPDILAANGLESVQELKPGMALNIPVTLILAVEKNIAAATEALHQAAQIGARILAATAMNKALTQHAKAQLKRRQGEWQAALNAAEIALNEARQALQETTRLRNQAGQALLENIAGTVQRRPPGGWAWQAAARNAVLVEQEKLRTLSNSFAEVRFRDDSSLRLNANAELLIQTLRADALNQRESTGVVLQGGDIYALLGGNAHNNQFELAIAGLETEIQSANFWVGRSEGATRFANYDGEIAVSAAGEKVVLKENQGTWVTARQAPAPPRDLPPPPQNLQPADYTVIYQNRVTLDWDAPPTAAAYWLEIARTRDFSEMLVNDKNIKEARYLAPLPDEGLYYWRVASLDRDGLPGNKSVTRFFKVRYDTTPPFLVLDSTNPSGIVADANVILTGKTESTAQLFCDEEIVEVQADGSFTLTRTLQPGDNILRLRARDPAGNISEVEVTLHYQSENVAEIHYDEALPRLDTHHFVSRQPTFTLSGRTNPGVKLDFQHADALFQLTVVAGADGHFQVNVPVSGSNQRVNVRATLPNGAQNEESIYLSFDDQAPQIWVDSVVPALTNAPRLELHGRLENGKHLSINDKAVALAADGGFSTVLDLQEGLNQLFIKAEDEAGNQALWQRQVLLDSEAPRLLGYVLTPTYASGGDTVRIEIKASDSNGLKAGGHYSLRVGEEIISAYLRLCPARTCYHGEVRLPANAKGKITLHSISLEDYAGNRL